MGLSHGEISALYDTADEDGDGVPTETVHKKGWLSKEGSKGVSIGFIHNWQRRFIDLNNGEFSYYTNDDMFEFKGSIILDKDSSVTYLKPDDARRMPNDKSIGQYFFCVHAKEGKVQRVSADTERERREWMERERDRIVARPRTVHRILHSGNEKKTLHPSTALRPAPHCALLN